MTDERSDAKELKNPGYEIFVGLLSILSIVNLVLLIVFSEDAALKPIVLAMNGLLSLIFFVDFSFRLFTASSKSDYFFRSFGWADLLASLPFPQTKILRLFRLWRVYRLLKVYGFREITRLLVADRAGSALFILLLAGILVLEFGSLTMVAIEADQPGATITTAADGLWYTIVTISTVGYGDLYPVTSAGRLMGAMIIVVGVGIFGTFTGYLANSFLSGSKRKDPPRPAQGTDPPSGPAATEQTELKEQVAELRRLVAHQQQALDEVDALLGHAGP